MRRRSIVLSFLAAVSMFAETENRLPSDSFPEVVKVGAGSYASRPPRDQNMRPWLPGRYGWGDDSQLFSRMPLYVSPENLNGKTKRPIPSTDWWTSLVTMRWSGQLWMYPSQLKATPAGIEFRTPRIWFMEPGARAGHMVSSTKLVFGAENFTPTHAEAVDWSDWMVRGRLPDSAKRSITFTAVHGGICTVMEYSPGLNPVIAVASGRSVPFSPAPNSASLEMLGLELDDGLFGIYAPSGTRLAFSGATVRVKFPGSAKKRFLTVAPLNSKEDLTRFAPYAAVVPRTTKVSWKYTPEKGAVETLWEIRTEDLEGRGRSAVLQGWLPHHYQLPSKADFRMDSGSYPCPRGELRTAAGNSFRVVFPFTGLLPAYPRPDEKTAGEPFDPTRMKQLIESHRNSTGYGSETYWGGKRVLHFGRYMDLARQFNLPETAALYRSRAEEAVRDWLTFTPGEGEHFFAWYPRWGSFVGCRSRDNANPGVDILQDHHMCYGYHLYTAALLFFQDKKLAADYGPMATLVARDYAEWDAESKMFCRFRNLDPWCGHSWSGGLGSEQGNGQESSSEAMQGYGAMFLLGESLNHPEMRDAAAFCYAMEARGIAEYYFDRKRRNLPKSWPHSMNTNVHTDGIGFWTWFSANPFWMHAIQWLPMSPLLAYLFEDPAYAESDFNRMWQTHEGGKGWDGYMGTDSPVANLVLNYLAGFDAERAAKVYRMLADKKLAGAAGVEAAHTYWRIHALKRLGPHRFDAWTDVPTSQVFGRSRNPEELSWVVCNAADAPRRVRCFIDGRQIAEFTAPPNCLSVMKNGIITRDTGGFPPPKQVKSGTEASEISRGCPVSASSELGGNRAANLTDGNDASRWESKHGDNQWAVIDFQRKCRLERIVLHWEGAFTADYDIQLSRDGKQWNTVKAVRGGKGGTETHTLAGTGRYLRLSCLRRGTPWGNSLFSVAVYGRDASDRRLRIVPDIAQVNEMDKVKFSAFIVDRTGRETPAKNVSWEVVRNRFSGGSMDADGIFTPKGSSNFEQPRIEIRASLEDMTGRAFAVVEEALRVKKIALSPFPKKGILKIGQGMKFPVYAELYDQFGVTLEQKAHLGTRGDALQLKNGRLTGVRPGRGVVFAEAAGVRTEHEVEVVPPDQADIAAGRPSSASSTQGANDASKAFDRDGSTRWESAFHDPQWLQIDLGEDLPLSGAMLVWENAYARKYTLNVSSDGINWKCIHRQDAGKGGKESIRFPNGTKGRYLRLTGTERSTAYGYSLWTFEVYRR